MEFECCVTCTTSMTPKPVHHDRMLERSIKIEATSRENMCKDDVGKVVMDRRENDNGGTTQSMSHRHVVYTPHSQLLTRVYSRYSQSFSPQLSYLMTYSISTQHGFTKVQSPLLVASGHCTQALSSYPTGQAPQLWLKHNKDNGCI